MYTFHQIIKLISNWIRYSSSFWIEYFYIYYNDIVRDMYQILLESYRPILIRNIFTFS